MYYQSCAQFHYQMFVQFNAVHMQLCVQQQLLQSDSLSSTGQKNSTQFNGQKPAMDMSMMGQGNPGMMGMMPGVLPNMGGGMGADQQ